MNTKLTRADEVGILAPINLGGIKIVSRIDTARPNTFLHQLRAANFANPPTHMLNVPRPIINTERMPKNATYVLEEKERTEQAQHQGS